MRKLCLLLFLLLGLPAYAVDPACTGLCLQQVMCTGGGTTSITGTVYAPNGTDPLPNVLVFIPNAPVAAFTPGVACPVPGAPPSGAPLVGAITAADGTFKLVNVPVGTNIPLVIQSGRWRRQLTVATTTSCADTAFSARMPRNQTEGDIPLIAVATGNSDAVECVLRKVGLDNAEFTNPLSPGRIHLYSGSGGPGSIIDANTPTQDTLMADPAELAKYDVVMLPCQGTPARQGSYASSSASAGNLLNYANSGGRIYASHYSDAWFINNGSFASVAGWPAASDSAASGSSTATINSSFTGGSILRDWMQNIGATTTPGQVTVNSYSDVIHSVNTAETQVWLTLNGSLPAIQQLTFNTPVGAANQCGRVLFNEYHVEIPASTPSGKSFPAECSDAPMTNQEKLLEYSLFDLTNTGGAVTITPAAADFGTQPVGFSTAPTVFTWKNNSIFATSVTSVAATRDFAVTSNTCLNVAPNASCQIGVVFKPSAIGPATGVLTVTSNASILTAALTGTGSAAISVSTTSLGFPRTDVGTSSTLTYTLQNVASGPVSLGALVVTGDYTVSNNCAAALALGNFCTLSVTFAPVSTGSRAGSIAVPGAPLTTLTGTGIDFTIAMTPASGSVIAGNSLTAPATLLPLAEFSSVVSIKCTTTAPGSTCVPNKASVVPSASAAVSVTITTTSKYTILGYSGFGRGLMGLLGLGSACLLWRRRAQARSLTLTAAGMLLLASACSLTSGCTGKLPAANAVYTPAGSYTYTLTATDGFLKHSATFTLNVTVN